MVFPHRSPTINILVTASFANKFSASSFAATGSVFAPSNAFSFHTISIVDRNPICTVLWPVVCGHQHNALHELADTKAKADHPAVDCCRANACKSISLDITPQLVLYSSLLFAILVLTPFTVSFKISMMRFGKTMSWI